MALRVAVLSVLLVFAASSSGPGWAVKFKGTAEGGGSRRPRAPAVRYAHLAAGLVGGRGFVVSHGYYYDAAGRAPRWLSDTWAFDGRAWRELSAGRGAERGAAPAARYATAGVLHDGFLYLHGGTDGGNRFKLARSGAAEGAPGHTA